jgi:glycosyltransferase involved in cell wall biosynthesis
VGLYAWLGEKAILPVIIATSAITLAFTWYFSSRVRLEFVDQSWLETMVNSKRLVTLGAAFMYGALLAAAVGFPIRALIVRDLGLEASGLYQAAWGLSGMFAGFILGAMGTDFYPRLLEAASYGLPVLQTSECNFPELTAAEGAWECVPNMEDLSKSLAIALNCDEGERHQRGEAGLHLVRESYSWSSIALRLHTACMALV